MEELIELIPVVLIAIVGLITSGIKAAGKSSQKKAAASPASSPWEASRQSQASAQAPVKEVKRPAAPLVKPMQPTVHLHLTPDCVTHDAPGSLDVTSQEGKDPCHQQLGAGSVPRSDFDQPGTEAPVLTFDWTSDSLVKAVVMQEVLQRPAQRRR